jgi:hypothetical protein
MNDLGVSQQEASFGDGGLESPNMKGPDSCPTPFPQGSTTEVLERSQETQAGCVGAHL